jgi:3-oxoacyl-(acyl-carrier-protein) synthase
LNYNLGATEGGLHPSFISGFSRAQALSTKYNKNPNFASRPFDKDRQLFNINLEMVLVKNKLKK